MIENKIIISDNNFKAKVLHLKNDMFLYHRLNDDQFKDSNTVSYYLALSYDEKLYDINIKSIYQFKDGYNFENAVITTKELLEKNNITGLKDDYIKSMIQAIEQNKWIYKWLFDIIKDYDNQNNTSYLSLVLKQREETLKMNEQKREEEKQQRMEEERKREQQAKEEQVRKEKENYCNGFTNRMNPMQKQKIYDILNKKYRYDGNIRTRKENTLVYLKNGYNPEVKTFYNKNKESYVFNKDNTYLEITKTEYDYATYLLNYGLEKAI